MELCIIIVMVVELKVVVNMLVCLLRLNRNFDCEYCMLYLYMCRSACCCMLTLIPRVMAELWNVVNFVLNL